MYVLKVRVHPEEVPGSQEPRNLANLTKLGTPRQGDAVMLRALVDQNLVDQVLESQDPRNLANLTKLGTPRQGDAVMWKRKSLPKVKKA